MIMAVHVAPFPCPGVPLLAACPHPAAASLCPPLPLQVSVQYTGGRGAPAVPPFGGKEGVMDLLVTENVFYGRDTQVRKESCSEPIFVYFVGDSCLSRPQWMPSQAMRPRCLCIRSCCRNQGVLRLCVLALLRCHASMTSRVASGTGTRQTTPQWQVRSSPQAAVVGISVAAPPALACRLLLTLVASLLTYRPAPLLLCSRCRRSAAG